MKPKHTPIILDRSRLESFATCPMQAYLSILWDVIKAMADGYQVFPWEKKIYDAADTELLAEMTKVQYQSTDGAMAECGIQIHALILRAFEACKNDLQMVPQWFVENLPKIKPNMTPMAIRHARHVGEMIADYHVNVIGLELQVSLVIVAETDTTPAIVVTTRIDLLGSGKGGLHVVDWKTGYKRRNNSETLESFQAGFIALLLFSQEEYKDVDTIHFWYYETMFGTKAYARFDRNEEHPRLPGLTTEVALKGRALEAVKLFQEDCKEAWPLPESCAWCDVIRFCPKASIGAKEIADDPAAFIDSLVVLEALVKERKKAATLYIKGHGALEGTKVVYTRKLPQERFTGGFEDKPKEKGN